MTRAGQMRVSALLKEQWEERAVITHQPDGGLIAYLASDNGQTVLCIADENSPILTCLCGLATTTTEELDTHLLKVFTPDDARGRDGERHEVRDAA